MAKPTAASLAVMAIMYKVKIWPIKSSKISENKVKFTLKLKNISSTDNITDKTFLRFKATLPKLIKNMFKNKRTSINIVIY